MSGEVVRYYMRWNPINGVTYMAEADGTAATLYVLATDYAALQTAFDRCHAESVERWRELIDAGRALEALQAKLDAVTKDSEAIRADIREIYEQIPNLPITPETMDAATDVLTKFCIDFNATITGSDHE